MKKNRVMVFALDGADPYLIERFGKEGVMKFIPSTIGGGIGGILQTTIPPATFPAWASFLTGLTPGRHGVFDFSRRLPTSRIPISFINSSAIRGITMLDLLSRSGRKVLSAFMPTTYPAFPVNGVMVSGFDSPISISLGPGSTYPASLYESLKRSFGSIPFAGFQEVEKGDGWRWEEEAIKLLKRGVEKKREIASYLMKLDDFDLFLFHFGEIDTVSHHFWAFFDHDSPRFIEGEERFRRAIPDIYGMIDEVVEELWQDGRKRGFTHLLFLSDHGFSGAGKGILFINECLKEGGFLSFKQSFPFIDLAFSYARRVGLKAIPERMIERLVHNPLGGSIALLLEANHRLMGIDMRRSIAFSEELNYSPSVWLNLKGREKKGVVSGRWAYQEMVETLRRYLEEIKDEEGRSIFDAVLTRDEVYKGPFTCLAPDLTLIPAFHDGFRYNFLRSEGGIRGYFLSELDDSQYRGAKGMGMNGVHNKWGVWGLSGDGIKDKMRLDIRIWDILPVIHFILSSPVPSCDGVLPDEIMRLGIGEFIEGGEITIASSLRFSRRFARDEEYRILERLKGLGYL